MNKTYIKIFLAAIFAMVPEAISAQSGQIRPVGSQAAHNVVWESKLRTQVEFLTDTICEGRAFGSRGAVEAAAWIGRRFQKIGLTPLGGSWYHRFQSPSGTNGTNVIGLLPGSLKWPRDSYIIVAAHFDGLGIIRGRYFPGADSDASGTVAMLSLAEMHKVMSRFGKPLESSIIFVGLDGKGGSMAGAEALWKLLENSALSDPYTGLHISREKVKMMVNLDQMGCTSSPLKSGRPDYLLMLGRSSLRWSDRDHLATCNDMWHTDLELCYDYYGSRDFTRLFYERISDQRIFVRQGLPAVMFTSGITMDNNKLSDNAESLDYTIYKRRIHLIFHWIEAILAPKPAK